MASQELRKVGKHNAVEIPAKPKFTGTFSKVYFGVFDNKEVAVKRVDRDISQEEELELLREFDHENIVRYLFMDMNDDFLYIVLEKCDWTLREFINDKQHVVPHLAILWQVVTGLAYLHNTKKIIHRDLKPCNILLISRDNRWIAKISDFGISKYLDPAKTKLTQTSVKGTVGYFAPETLKGEKINQRADIFSLGIIFTYVLSEGEHPFGSDILRLEADIRDGKIPPNLECLKNFEHDATSLILQMIAYKPEDRPLTTEVLAHHVFWDADKKLSFIQEVSDFCITGTNFPLMSPKLEESREKIVGDWRKIIYDESLIVKEVLEDMKHKRQKDGVCDLLRNIRNLKNHYNEKPEKFREFVGKMPIGFMKFFTSRFPKLLSYIYDVMKCQKETFNFKKFYQFRGPCGIDLACSSSNLKTRSDAESDQGRGQDDVVTVCSGTGTGLTSEIKDLGLVEKNMDRGPWGIDVACSSSNLKTRTDAESDQDRGQDDVVTVCSGTGTGLTSEIKDLGLVGKNIDSSGLQLRNYQWELATQALTGQNSLIVAPTGSGKTAVLTEVIRQHMTKSQHKRVMFLVPKTALARQQFQFLKKNLPEELDIRRMIGELTAEMDAGETILGSQLTILTPQILINELQKKRENRRVSFTDISLLIFDECHNATKSHPYRNLMNLLLDFQHDNPNSLPVQVIGVTASPGVGKGGDMEKVQKNLIELLSNLNVMSAPSIVEKNLAELEQHHSKIKEYFIQIETEKEVAQEILKVMTELENEIQRLANTEYQSKTAPGNKATQPYENWLDALKDDTRLHSKGGEESSHLIACVEHLRMYHVLLQLKDLIPNAMEQTKASRAFTGEAPDNDELNGKYKDLCKKAVNIRTPMYVRLVELIREEFKRNSDGRCIIFVERKATAKYLQKSFSVVKELALLNPAYLIGSKSSTGSEGITGDEQSNILDSFKEGKCKVLISTSVLEEGVDVSKCNLVIMYNYVTGEVGRIQRYGRGRASDSKAIILTTKNSNHKERENENKSNAEATKKAMEYVKNMKPEQLKALIMNAQRKHKVERKRKRKALPDGVENGEPPAKWKILCGTCKNFLTTGDKLRHIEEQHTVVKDREFFSHVEKRMVQKQKGPNVKGNSDFHCKQDKCGIKVALGMENKGRVYPALSIKKIIVENDKGERRNPKQRKNLPFKINRGVDDSEDDDDLFEEYKESVPVVEAESLDDQDCLELLDMMDAI